MIIHLTADTIHDERLSALREPFQEEKTLSVLVFTRSTPDTTAKVEVNAAGEVTWGDAATVVNPWDEYALEE
ncbi:MAG: hypothetical protein NZM00_13615, partial [Anaerolinea sp.]|nr:hypothetical protein [Anaerolinea sp.]